MIPYDKYRGHDEYTIKNRIWHSDHKKDKTYRKELRGGDVKRYSLIWNGNNWISYGNWLAAPRKIDFFTQPRILIREITEGVINSTYTDEEFYNNPSIINCIERKKKSGYSLFFLLGIINSKLISKYHTIISPKAKKGVFPKILVNDVRNLPIPKNIPKKIETEIVKLVNLILQLYKEKSETKLYSRVNLLQGKIDYCEEKINKIVYQLYGLTEDEIKIIEGEQEFKN